MTRILFRRYYLLTIVVIGVTFWAFVTRLAPDVTSLAKDRVQTSKYSQYNRKVLTDTINDIEGEIASQKIYSSILLSKIRGKFEKPKAKEEDDNSNAASDGEGASKKLEEGRLKDEKLRKIQWELQQVAHPGEVHSLETDKQQQTHHRHKGGEEGKDANYDGNKNGEDFHQGEVIDGGGGVGAALIGNGNGPSVEHSSVIAVLVFVCNRPSVKRNLDQLFKYRPSAEKFPVIVSQDCGSHPATTSVIKSYGNKVIHIMQPDLSDIKVPPKEKKLKGYYNIARHYGWALNYTFNTLDYKNVLIVEDDLDIAPDFFEYFAATLPLLYKDPTLWCISAWNDNGKPKRINETAYDLLHRTDFFPGLGWLMTKNLWTELMVKWPRGYWDDWMREPPQRKDRSCIRPEISRTSTFGKDGVSHGTYYQNHLRFIKLNDHFVPFTSQDLSYLHKDKYDDTFVKRVYSSQLVNSVEELKRVTAEAGKNGTKSGDTTEFRLTFRTKADFRIFAKKLEIMEDFRAGVPRTAYRGVVPFMLNNRRVYLAPGANWNSYQP